MERLSLRNSEIVDRVRSTYYKSLEHLADCYKAVPRNEREIDIVENVIFALGTCMGKSKKQMWEDRGGQVVPNLNTK